MKKFKLRKDLSIDFDGHTLYRIECTKAIESKNIEVGSIGGYIEKEENLCDNAWVFGNAMIYENACACDEARVFHEACVHGNAKISEYARVGQSSKVFGNARVFGNAEVFEQARIYDNALIFDESHVYGMAKVYDDAKVFDESFVCGDAKVHGNATIGANSWVSDDDLLKPEDCININSEGEYNITITRNFMGIMAYFRGNYYFKPKNEWWDFADEEIKCLYGKKTLEWWKINKPILMSICGDL